MATSKTHFVLDMGYTLEVVIPESVELIGGGAFFLCEHLRHAVIKSKNTVIKSGAFSDLFRLQMIVEPGSLAEEYCKEDNVDYIYPDQVSWLPDEYSFGDYTYSLFKDGTAEITEYQGESTDLVIPEVLDGITVSSIGRGAFIDNRSDLTSVKIPRSVKCIEARAFLYCYKLENVEVSEGLKEINESAFEGCEKLKQIVLPSGLETIGDSAFSGCGLTCAVIPDTVTEIGNMAFGWCKQLVDISMPRQGSVLMGEDVFIGCDSIK